MLSAILRTLIVPLTLGAVMTASPAAAQASASTYSYGTYNPVQAAINRNSMNAAILRQATRGSHKGHAATTRRRVVAHRRRR